MECLVAKQFLPVVQPGDFKVSEVDRIVHVTQGIQVTKPDFDVGRELERRHLLKISSEVSPRRTLRPQRVWEVVHDSPNAILENSDVEVDKQANSTTG